MGYAHTESEAGISWYTHMWQMFPEGVPANCELLAADGGHTLCLYLSLACGFCGSKTWGLP